MYFCPDILNTFLIAHFAISKIYNQDARFPSVLYTMFPKYPQPYDDQNSPAFFGFTESQADESGIMRF